MRANEPLTDHSRFCLDADLWKACLKTLGAPARSLPRLDQLIEEPSLFERAAEG
jgi:hypothetical protein